MGERRRRGGVMLNGLDSFMDSCSSVQWGIILFVNNRYSAIVCLFLSIMLRFVGFCRFWHEPVCCLFVL